MNAVLESYARTLRKGLKRARGLRSWYRARMGADAHSAAAFYGSARGGVACRLLRERVLSLWPDLSRQSVLGLGFAAPYLRAWRGQAGRCVAALPAQVGAARWPLVDAQPGLHGG